MSSYSDDDSIELDNVLIVRKEKKVKVLKSKEERAESKRLRLKKLKIEKLIKLEKLKSSDYYDEKHDEEMKTTFYGEKLANVLNEIKNGNTIILENKEVLDLITYEIFNKISLESFIHAKRRINLFPVVDRQEDYTLKCVYSGIVLEDSLGNQLEKCDEEHCFPQSFQARTGKGCGRDLHQMFACIKEANGSRGNVPYGKTENSKLIKDCFFGSYYDTKIKINGVEEQYKSFVPKLNSGAVCRATLYIMTTYHEATDANRFPRELLNWVIKTAIEEKVTLWEKHRNYQIHILQNNRNMFIDYPFLANLICFDKAYQKK